LSPKKTDRPTVAAFALHDTLVNDSTSDEVGLVDRVTLDLISSLHD